MAKSKRELPGKSNKIKIALIVLILCVIGLLVLKTIYNHKKPSLPESWTVPQLKNPATEEQQQKAGQTAAPEAQQETKAPAVESTKKLTPCQKVAGEINDFYQHLEGQEYIKAYELHEPVGDHITKIVIKLLNNPPVVVSESENLFTVLKNTAHFYRVLGPKDLSFVKDILTYENDDLERIMAIFYKWSQLKNCQDTSVHLHLPLDKLYEHACFFLNTLGGQSYLFRRDSRLRILTKYYCVLIIDQAAKEKKNKYGIDLPQIIKSVIKDITETETLDNQEQYLTTLHRLESELQQPAK